MRFGRSYLITCRRAWFDKPALSPAEGLTTNGLGIFILGNFGDDRVIVRTAVMMCEGARKEHGVLPGQPPKSFGTPGEHVLACYRIQEGDSPQAKVELENRNFGKDRVIVGPAVLMCEEANKRTRDNGEGVGQPNGFVWECYALNEGDDPNVTVVLETKNFGKDKVIVRHARLMCERAKKDHSHSLTAADDLTG